MSKRTSSRGVRSLLSLTAVALAACTAAEPGAAPLPSPAHPLTTPPARTGSATSGSAVDVALLEGRIVFSAGPAHGEEVYVVNANGSGLRQLTRNTLADFDPALSPDGTMIVYRHELQDSSTAEVYVMAADGTRSHDVSNDAAADWGPTWSPDGNEVLWNCQRDLEAGFRACRANPDGTGLRIIPADIYVEYPAWSPDGTRIAFMSQEEGASGDDPDYNVYVMNTDGSGIRRLTDAPGSDGFPSWSPDGTKIAFSTTREDCRNSEAADCRTTGDVGPYHEIWIMNADGSDQHRLSGTFGQFAGWSPEGDYLVFSPGLNVIRPDGGGETQLPIAVGGDIEFANWGV